MQKDFVSFKQAEIPPEVISYLKEQKINLKNEFKHKNLMHEFITDINNYAAERLEGIQKGIEIFDGLNFTQIKYLISKLSQIAVRRGCNNHCIHCYAEAETPYFMKKNNLTDKISFEDYKKLIHGFKELNRRLGFNALQSDIFKTLSLFFDSDCSMVNLQDKNGKMYDYADLSKMLYKIAHRCILFDTAGWNINDKATQQRMESLVQKIVNSKEYDFLLFNVSINPFHSIYSKAIEFEKKGDIEKSKKLRKIYTNRMANVIYTFSPIIDKKNVVNDHTMLRFIILGLRDGEKTQVNNYTKSTTEQICNEIIEKLEELYTKDLFSSTPKIVKDESQKNKYLDYIKEIFSNHLALMLKHQPVSITNKRLANVLDNKTIGEYNEKIADRLHNSAEKAKSLFGTGIIDVNGKFYMTNDFETYPTNITLNYHSKGKTTAHIAPNLRDEMIKI